jgi:hypothetical protein
MCNKREYFKRKISLLIEILKSMLYLIIEIGKISEDDKKVSKIYKNIDNLGTSNFSYTDTSNTQYSLIELEKSNKNLLLEIKELKQKVHYLESTLEVLTKDVDVVTKDVGVVTKYFISIKNDQPNKIGGVETQHISGDFLKVYKEARDIVLIEGQLKDYILGTCYENGQLYAENHLISIISKVAFCDEQYNNIAAFEQAIRNSIKDYITDDTPLSDWLSGLFNERESLFRNIESVKHTHPKYQISIDFCEQYIGQPFHTVQDHCECYEYCDSKKNIAFIICPSLTCGKTITKAIVYTQ